MYKCMAEVVLAAVVRDREMRRPRKDPLGIFQGSEKGYVVFQKLPLLKYQEKKLFAKDKKL